MKRFSLALFALGLVSSCALATDVQTILQPSAKDIEQQRRDRKAWLQEAVRDPYEKVGKKNTRWDKDARLALDAAVRYWASRNSHFFEEEVVWEHADKAIKAGCDDPYIRYLFARMYPNGLLQSVAQRAALFEEAANLFDKSSDRSVFQRAIAHAKVGVFVLQIPNFSPEEKTRAQAQLDTAIKLLPDVIKDTRPYAQDDAYGLCLEILGGYHLATKDRKIGFDKIAPILEKAPANKALWLAVKGRYYVDYAWDGRGKDAADKLTPEQIKALTDRMHEAELALEEGWEVAWKTREPLASTIAAQMMVVELAQGKGRDRLDKWFERALLADGDSLDACEAKLNYLQPKWHGSNKELVAFGKACAKTNNWEGNLPMALLAAHDYIARTLEQAKVDDYYRRPEVWADVKSYYDGKLKRDPKDRYSRTGFAMRAVVAAQYAEAKRQFDILGDGYSRMSLTKDGYAAFQKLTQEGLSKKK